MDISRRQFVVGSAVGIIAPTLALQSEATPSPAVNSSVLLWLDASDTVTFQESEDGINWVDKSDLR